MTSGEFKSVALGMSAAGSTSMRNQHVLPGTPGTWLSVAPLCVEAVPSASAAQILRPRDKAGNSAFAAERAHAVRVSVSRSRFLT